MGRTIRWGVVGSGGIARRRTIPEGILPAADTELVGVYSRDPERNAAVARDFGTRAAGSLDELLAARPDAVYVASPPAAHVEQVARCAQAGVHVLCEKPLGLGVADAEAIVEACRIRGVLLGTAFMMRFSSQHRAAVALVREGRLGTLVTGRAQLSCWYPPIPGAWRQAPETGGGGALIDLGGHCIDLLEQFFGPVSSVSCRTGRVVHAYPVEDTAVVALEFRRGGLATVDVSFAVPDNACQNRLELYGTRGSLLAEGTVGQEAGGEMWVVDSDPDAAYEPSQDRETGRGRRVDPVRVNPYRAEIEAFGDAIREGREPDPGGEAGLWSQRVLAACYHSAAAGRTVTLPGPGAVHGEER